jgi:hypothetical protein
MQTQITDRLSREEVHRQVEGLKHANWRVRAILHAMVDAGTLPRLECQLPNCYMDSREFETQKQGRGHNGKGLVIDHIVPQLQGGSDRPENLRAIHATCNVSRAKGWKMSEEAKARIGAAAKARGGWKYAIAKRPPAWNCVTRPDDGRTRRLLTDEQVREMRSLYRSGVSVKVLAERYDVGGSTARHAIHRQCAYADVL